jgi:hypothetical protein
MLVKKWLSRNMRGSFNVVGTLSLQLSVLLLSVDGLAAIGTMNPLCIVSFFTSTSWPYAQHHAWISLPELDVDYEMVTVNNYKTRSRKTFLSLMRAGWQTQFLMVLVPRCLSYCLQVLHQNNVFLCKKSHCITVLYIAKKHHVLQPYAFPWRCCQPCLEVTSTFIPLIPHSLQ